MVGFVLGNGESRKDLDPRILAPYGPIIGCNGFYRDYQPNLIVAVDPPMVKEIKASGYKGATMFCDTDICISAKYGKYKHHGWSSGASALFFMCTLFPNVMTTYMIGFDCIAPEKKINNIYKGTLNYGKAGSLPVHPGSWYKEALMVFEMFPEKRFRHVGALVHPKEWESRVHSITRDQMFQEIGYGRVNP